jgi:undecaprenyl-diphosphatase
MVLIWIIFDKILIINYRPILINGNIEGSYPSTHVMVSTFVLLFLSDKLKKIFKNDKIFYIISIGLILIQSISRILLKMHWFTDIIGGLLIGCLLFFTFLRGEYGFNNNV